MNNEIINYKNTVLFVEPRNINHVFVTLHNAFNILKDDWNYVFYCGKGVYDEWKNIMPYYVELRQLDSDNWVNGEYSEFFKTKELWLSLTGDFILTTQLDVWLFNDYPYTIDYFIKQDRSYIGGNMCYSWKEFASLGITSQINNFNGGLSLRKRRDMIKIIDYFNHINEPLYNNLPEDVYFTVGCYKLQLKTGDEDETMQFAVHCIYYDKCFGVHHMWDNEVQTKILSKCPYLLDINPYVCGSRVLGENLSSSKPMHIHVPKKQIIDNSLSFTQSINIYNHNI
jgi:hypothetical protein